MQSKEKHTQDKSKAYNHHRMNKKRIWLRWWVKLNWTKPIWTELSEGHIVLHMWTCIIIISWHDMLSVLDTVSKAASSTTASSNYTNDKCTHCGVIAEPGSGSDTSDDCVRLLEISTATTTRVELDFHWHPVTMLSDNPLNIIRFALLQPDFNNRNPTLLQLTRQWYDGWSGNSTSLETEANVRYNIVFTISFQRE